MDPPDPSRQGQGNNNAGAAQPNGAERASIKPTNAACARGAVNGKRHTPLRRAAAAGNSAALRACPPRPTKPPTPTSPSHAIHRPGKGSQGAAGLLLPLTTRQVRRERASRAGGCPGPGAAKGARRTAHSRARSHLPCLVRCVRVIAPAGWRCRCCVGA